MAVEPQIDDALMSKPRLLAPEHTSVGEVTIVPVSRVIEMYSVSEQELDQISRAAGSVAVHLVFFGIAFGAALAFLISLLTQELSNKTVALVWALFALTLAAVYFGIQATRSYHDAGRGVRTIKKESVRSSSS
ncbi:MAG TPA: hypothetical protein VGZ23_13065 [bacterium]|nr:hypothetical protein [bacterium]